MHCGMFLTPVGGFMGATVLIQNSAPPDRTHAFGFCWNIILFYTFDTVYSQRNCYEIQMCDLIYLIN